MGRYSTPRQLSFSGRPVHVLSGYQIAVVFDLEGVGPGVNRVVPDGTSPAYSPGEGSDPMPVKGCCIRQVARHWGPRPVHVREGYQSTREISSGAIHQRDASARRARAGGAAASSWNEELRDQACWNSDGCTGERDSPS